MPVQINCAHLPSAYFCLSIHAAYPVAFHYDYNCVKRQEMNALILTIVTELVTIFGNDRILYGTFVDNRKKSPQF